jgi:hypothetical protein
MCNVKLLEARKPTVWTGKPKLANVTYGGES